MEFVYIFGLTTSLQYLHLYKIINNLLQLFYGNYNYFIEIKGK